MWNNSDIVIEKTKEIEKVVEDEVTEPEPPVQVQAEPVVAEVVVPIGNTSSVLHFVIRFVALFCYFLDETILPVIGVVIHTYKISLTHSL